MQSDTFRVQAQEDFSKARNKAWINEMQHVMHPDKKRLLSFNDVKKILKPKNEVYIGLKTVPIKKIVGSEGRYNDFDNQNEYYHLKYNNANDYLEHSSIDQEHTLPK